MNKELTGDERRQKLLSMIRESDKPLSGTLLGKLTGVSRQVVVQDIALLRSMGYSIESTARGYVVSKAGSATRMIKVCHSCEDMEKELNTIVDLGGTVMDVSVNHRTYGIVKGELNISSRRDVKHFIENIESGKSSPLMNITSGYHFHNISAQSEELLDEIESELEKLGFIAERLPYED